MTNKAQITVNDIKGWLAIEDSPFTLLTTRSGDSIFVMMDIFGAPTVKEICYLLHKGEGEQPGAWKGGSLPAEDGVRNDGSGWIIGSVVLHPDADGKAIREKLMQRMAEMRQLLTEPEPVLQ